LSAWIPFLISVFGWLKNWKSWYRNGAIWQRHVLNSLKKMRAGQAIDDESKDPINWLLRQQC